MYNTTITINDVEAELLVHILHKYKEQITAQLISDLQGSLGSLKHKTIDDFKYEVTNTEELILALESLVTKVKDATGDTI